MTYKKVLVVPDMHVPNHDPNAVRVALDFKKDFKPDITIFLGDLIDADAVSAFASTERDYDQADEFYIAGEILDKFKPQVLLEGNHEQRLRRPGCVPWELWRMVEPKKWFAVKKRKIQWVPYSNRKKDLFKIGKMTFIHGFCCSQYATRAEAEAFGCVCHGHTHRVMTYQPKHAYERNTGFNIGCLCKMDLEYQTTGRPRGWCQAFGFGYFLRSGNFSFYTARLIGETFIINGKTYKRKAG